MGIILQISILMFEIKSFDEQWENYVSSTVKDTLNVIQTDKSAMVSTDCIDRAIKALPIGKAGNSDGVVYEHLRFGREVIVPVLANMFTFMLRLGHIPNDMKKGVIITLYKGGKKSKDDPASYRAITLSSVLLKLYETVLLNRCSDLIYEQISKQQGRLPERAGLHNDIFCSTGVLTLYQRKLFKGICLLS